MSIEKIVFGLAKIFPDINFDVDIEKFGDGSEKFKVWVGDLRFYLENQKFKMICKALKKRYPKVKWYAYYCRIKE